MTTRGLGGIWPALLTPLTDGLDIDLDRLARHARALIEAGCAGVTPFGMLLFVTHALTGIPIRAVLREGWPFLVALPVLLLAITLFPQLVLWLPRTMGYRVAG